jgi:ribonuclease HI
MATSLQELLAFTDGGCQGNGYAQAMAASAVHFPECTEYSVSERLPGDLQTNNRAEYYGALLAMQTADQIDASGTRKLRIFTDSLLLVNTYNTWMKSWHANGWKKKGKKNTDIKNLDLVKQLYNHSMGRRKIVMEHVRAHTGGSDFKSVNNAVADDMCTRKVQQLLQEKRELTTEKPRKRAKTSSASSDVRTFFF